MASRYTLKITLDRITPTIWREVEVPSDCDLVTLGGTIIRAMGWRDTHLCAFIRDENGEEIYYAACKECITPYMLQEYDYKDGSKKQILKFLKNVGDTIKFEYDFGDSWRHTVTLIKKERYKFNDEQLILLHCGARACPPDDCGGVFGYQELCKAVKDPKSATSKEYDEWLGYHYDPDQFIFYLAERDVFYINSLRRYFQMFGVML